MQRNPAFPKVTITAEVHPQFSGDIDRLKTVIQQCKLGGADAVKVQLYDSMKLFGNRDRKYLQFNRDELSELKSYCDALGIELYASIFNQEYIAWCEDLNFSRYKIASRTVASDSDLCQAILATGKQVLVSLGAWDWKVKGFPFERDDIVYFYCIANYPTLFSEVEMPAFGPGGFQGYSDHTVGIGACLFAVAQGATYLEKHYSLDKSFHFATEGGHMGSMDLDDLKRLRKYADEFAILYTAADKASK